MFLLQPVHDSIVIGARDSFYILNQEVLYLFITANAGLFCFMAIKMQ